MRVQQKWIWLVPIVIGLIIIPAYFLWRPTPSKTPTTPVARGDITEQVVVSGQIVPAHAVQVKSPLSGVAGDIKVHEGDYVHKNQALMTVDPNATPDEYNTALAQVHQDQAKLAKSTAAYQRALKLHQQQFISENELEEKRTDYTLDIEKLREDQVTLDLLLKGTAEISGKKVVNQIESPIDGYIISKNVEPGNNITPITQALSGTVLFIIADMHDLQFRGQVSQIDVGKLKPGLPAELTIAALPKLKLQGKITKISLETAALSQQNQPTGGGDLFKQTTSNPNGYTITIAGFQLPEDLILRAGYQATATITVQEAHQVLLLPQAAIHDEGEQAYVLLPGQKGKPRKQKVTLGLSNALDVEIQSGLQEGEQVLTEGLADKET